MSYRCECGFSCSKPKTYMEHEWSEIHLAYLKKNYYNRLEYLSNLAEDWIIEYSEFSGL